ncbi:DUF1345 domain-containing protein [Leifsonia sp. fls2-241-R2A-40a]|uniref:DUF1345 domain-containing protein n=1 Tax=Leifsonia sp. fls2-241-R2A-40a TaxID=3040290 RepID=UPI00254C63EA|nr:DUF1345 domain-containing protein [Leifsonia sp. fls2-241-R2A-40a]
MSQTLPARRPSVVVGFVASLMVQLVMIVVGVWVVIFAEDDASTLLLLGIWCAIGTLYEITTLIVLGRVAKQPSVDGRRPARWETGRIARLVSMTATIFASLIGFTAAFEVLGPHNDPQTGSLMDVVGVWAMLLAWGFFHWGFAQIYYQRFWSADEPMLRFPGTDHPRFIDFVYFAYTLGTTFAASDVEVRSTRMRWTIVWHSVLSYFFNGLVIVLALNTIMSTGK